MVRQRIASKNLSQGAISDRVAVDRGHLGRVLRGERRVSSSLLAALEVATEEMAPRHVQEQSARLIDAAVHVFFLKRGINETPIFGYAPISTSIE